MLHIKHIHTNGKGYKGIHYIWNGSCQITCLKLAKWVSHQSQGLFILIVCFSSFGYQTKVALPIVWGDSTSNLQYRRYIRITCYLCWLRFPATVIYTMQPTLPSAPKCKSASDMYTSRRLAGLSLQPMICRIEWVVKQVCMCVLACMCALADCVTVWLGTHIFAHHSLHQSI